jgi:hypothetical protein
MNTARILVLHLHSSLDLGIKRGDINIKINALLVSMHILRSVGGLSLHTEMFHIVN